MQILIADDDESARGLLSAALKGLGHVVYEAADGLSAWVQWQQSPSPLVIADWNMPGLEGPELVRRIRAAGEDSYTYFILLTSRGAESDLIAGLEAGADDYLTKPFHMQELGARIAIGERTLKLEARLKTALAQQEDLATHDTLTGLYNRRALYEQAELEIARAQRDGAAVGLVLVDIDHFKAINDQRGQRVGDQALRFLADMLTQIKRPYDLAGRWGGEEFMLVLPGAKLDDARHAAERLRTAVAGASFVAHDRAEVQLQVSACAVSTSSFPDGAVGLTALLQRADELLDRAKREGRNRVCV